MNVKRHFSQMCDASKSPTSLSFRFPTSNLSTQCPNPTPCLPEISSIQGPGMLSTGWVLYSLRHSLPSFSCTCAGQSG